MDQDFNILVGDGLSGGGPSVTLGIPIPAKADLIFRPDPEAAMLTPDFSEIWGEEIVYRDVPIK